MIKGCHTPVLEALLIDPFTLKHELPSASAPKVLMSGKCNNSVRLTGFKIVYEVTYWLNTTVRIA